MVFTVGRGTSVQRVASALTLTIIVVGVTITLSGCNAMSCSNTATRRPSPDGVWVATYHVVYCDRGFGNVDSSERIELHRWWRPALTIAQNDDAGSVSTIEWKGPRHLVVGVHGTLSRAEHRVGDVDVSYRAYVSPGWEKAPWFSGYETWARGSAEEGVVSLTRPCTVSRAGPPLDRACWAVKPPPVHPGRVRPASS